MNAFYTKTNKITKKFLLTAPCISLFIIVITGLTLLPLVISYPEGSEVVPIFLALLFLALSALTFLLIGVPALCRRKKLVSKYEALPDADKAKIADDLHREFNGYMLRQNHLYFYQWQFINFTSYRDQMDLSGESACPIYVL